MIALNKTSREAYIGETVSTLAFFFESPEAALAAVQPLASAQLVERDYEIDRSLERYGIGASGDRCVLRVQLEPGHGEAAVTELLEQSGGRRVAVPPDDQLRLSLEVERLRTEQLWRSIVGEHVPMSVAAATTFHQVHGTTNAIVTRKDYDDALNIAAGALSSLVPVYTRDAGGKWVEIAINLVTQRFAIGASQLRSASSVIDNLSVQRSGMLFALSIVKRAGLPFSFALLAPERIEPSAPPAEEPKQESGEAQKPEKP